MNIEEEIKPKLKRGRKPLNPEDRKLKPTKEYFKNYYNNSSLSEVVICPICSRKSTRQKLKRHQISKLCRIIE